MQHYTDTKLYFLESFMLIHHPDDITQGNIVRLHQHSENSGQHFKNTWAINYFTTLTIKHVGPNETVFVYSFGAPGHGKGPYDGIGGTLKRYIV